MIASGFTDVNPALLRDLCVIAAAAVGLLLGLKRLREKSPLPVSVSEDDAQSQRKVLEDLKARLSGLAPNEKIAELVEQLAKFATNDQLQHLRDELRGYVDQPQFERRMGAALEWIERVEKFAHDDFHKFRDEAQATWSHAEHQREGLHSRINVIAEAVSEIRGWTLGQRRGKAAS